MTSYPTMAFKSTSFVKTGTDTYSIKGELTLHGATKPVELKATYLGQAVDPWGNLRTGFKAATRINRYEFGLQWNRALEAGGVLVGKEIDITLMLQFVKR